MVVQVHKTGDTFSFTLPQQAGESLSLRDGDRIEIQRSEEAAPVSRYASVEEAMRAYERTRPANDAAYRELAK